MNEIPYKIDDEVLTDDEAEAWAEKFAICIHSSDIMESDAIEQADNRIRSMRK